mgnify:CR=1 FL=1
MSTRVIAEIGTAHAGDDARARELVDAAVEAGADIVKTQIVYAGEIVHPNTGPVELPGGPVPLFERFRELEVAPDFFVRLADHCEHRGVAFLASCFGPRSLADLLHLRASAVKIASPELNHAPLLQSVRDAGLELILSSGVSTLCDIERALHVTGVDSTTLLHCVTAYPAPETEYNLRTISTLSAAFGVSVGISDHSTDPVLVPAAAVALGAPVVEKHFTLSRTYGGLDDPIALEPQPFAEMVAAIRAAETQSTDATLADLAARYGTDRLAAVLGDGVKRLAAAEAANYGRSNRSILATANIAAGELLGPENIAVLRSEKNIEPGLSPFHWETVAGARATRDIADGTGILWEHLIRR